MFMKPMMDSILIAGVILTAVAGLLFVYLYLSNTYILSDKAQAITFAQTVTSAANSLSVVEEGSFYKSLDRNFTVTIEQDDGESVLRVVYGKGAKDFYETRFLCKVGSGGPKVIDILIVSKKPGEYVQINDFSGGIETGPSCTPITQPDDFRPIISSASSKHSIDSGFLKATIRKLSAFRHCENNRVVSGPNAVGAMMLTDQMRLYATDSSTELGSRCIIQDFDYRKLEDNINAGSCYLGFVREIFRGNDDWMRLTSAAYMCGHDMIKRLVEERAAEEGVEPEEIGWDDIKGAASLPNGCANFDETQKHVDGVFRYYNDCWSEDADCWGDECILC